MGEASGAASTSLGASARPRRPRASTVALAVLLLLVVRVGYLWSNDLWYDDIFTYETAALPWREMVARTANDVHPPLFYLLIHPIARFAGPNPILLRLPTLVAGLAAAALTWAAIRRAFGGNVATVGLLLMVASAPHQHFSGEARSYALAMFFLALALWSIVALATSFREGVPARELWRLRALWFLAIVGGIYTHNLVALFAPFWVVGSALAAGVAARRATEGWMIFALGGVAALLYVPWFLVGVAQVDGMGQSLVWMPRPTATMMAGALFFMPMSWARPSELAGWPEVLVCLSVGAGAAFVGGAWGMRHRRAARPACLAVAYVVAAMCLYYAGAHVVSHLRVRLVFAPRFAAILWVPWMFAAAPLLASIRRRGVRAAAIALFVVPGLVDQAVNLVVPIHPRTRTMLVRAMAHAEPGEKVYLFATSEAKVREILFHAEDLERRQGIARPLEAMIRLVTPPYDGRPRRVVAAVWGLSATLGREPVHRAFEAVRACAARSTRDGSRLGGWTVYVLEDIAWERYRGRIVAVDGAGTEVPVGAKPVAAGPEEAAGR